jgi:predicted O-methyltransferase YrrM
MQEKWTEIDRYLSGAFKTSDPVLDDALREADKAGLPAIQVSPQQGKLLMLLAQMIEAKTILEIGTLAGYSTIWLARALPATGRLITLEADANHAEIARRNIARAGFGGQVEVRLGKALKTLPQISEEGLPPFDLFFIDADKKNIPEYFSWCLKLSRPGSIIIVDNVVRDGGIIDPQADDASTEGIRRFFQQVAAQPRVSGTALQTVGVKGHDGLAIVRVTA